MRNGDVLVPGYDVEGKLWTIQYIKEDGTKRFAKEFPETRLFPRRGRGERGRGVAKACKLAGDRAGGGLCDGGDGSQTGNLLAVATALHERWRDKRVMIAGDDDHKLENNPGRVKALEAALAVHGIAVCPNSTAEQREKGMTDFDDLALENCQPCSRLPAPESGLRLFPSPHAGPGPEEFECIQFQIRRRFGPSEPLGGRAKRAYWWRVSWNC